MGAEKQNDDLGGLTPYSQNDDLGGLTPYSHDNMTSGNVGEVCAGEAVGTDSGNSATAGEAASGALGTARTCSAGAVTWGMFPDER